MSHYTYPTLAPRRATVIEKLTTLWSYDNVMIACLIGFLFYETCEGLIRMMFLKAHVPALSYYYYIFILTGAIGWSVRAFLRKPLVGAIVAILVAFHLIVGAWVTQDPRQVGMGVRFLLNIPFAAAIAPYLFRPGKPVRWTILGLFFINVIGLMINYKYGLMPWNKVHLDVGGVKASGAEVFYSGGTYRGAGFTVGNGTAAGLGACLTISLLCMMKNRFWSAVVIVLSFAALWETNMKVSILFFLPVCGALWLLRRDFLAAAIKAQIAIFGTMMFMLPLATIGWHFQMPSKSSSMFSLIDRIDNTWAIGWDLIFNRGGGLLGRGLGGVGTPQKFFEKPDFFPVDNGFMYFFGWFGVFSVIYLGIMYFAALRADGKNREVILPLAAFAFTTGYAVTSAILEEPTTVLYYFGAFFFLQSLPVGAKTVRRPLPVLRHPLTESVAGAH